MSTRTIRDNIAAASFAFLTSAIVCGAVLVASTSMAPAQTNFPGDGQVQTSQVPGGGWFNGNKNWAPGERGFTQENGQGKGDGLGQLPAPSTTTTSTTLRTLKK